MNNHAKTKFARKNKIWTQKYLDEHVTKCFTILRSKLPEMCENLREFHTTLNVYDIWNLHEPESRLKYDFCEKSFASALIKKFASRSFGPPG